jgi:hypothetical protein
MKLENELFAEASPGSNNLLPQRRGDPANTATINVGNQYTSARSSVRLKVIYANRA